MTKRLMIILLLGFFALGIQAQKGEYAVRNFGANMQSWGQTSKLEYQKKLQKLCDGAKSVRVCDEIVESLAPKNGYAVNGSSYFLETYLNCLIKEIKKGIHIQYSNFKTINVGETTVYDTRGLELIACNIVISGAVNYNVKDLFYVRNGKISKIDKYEEIVDKHTGKRKVKVDLSDIDFDEETIGLTYNYGQHFNIGASISYAIPWFMVSFDFGLANKMDAVTSTKVEMTDIMNYTITTTSLKPKMFFTITPALNLKYIAVGCGVGVLYMKGNEMSKFSYGKSYTGGYSYGSSTSESDAEKLKFMLRPSIKGFIPLSDEWSLVVGAGYDYAFKYKKCNGFNFSLGFQYSLDW